MPLLEYSKWENFDKVIQKAVIAYKNSNNDDSYWLPEVRKPIITGKGKEVNDYFTGAGKNGKRYKKFYKYV